MPDESPSRNRAAAVGAGRSGFPLRAAVEPGLWHGFVLPVQSVRLLLQLRGVKWVSLLPVVLNLFLYAAVIAGSVWLIGRWHWHVSGQPWQFWGGFGAWLHGLLEGTVGLAKWAIALPVLFGFCYFSFTAVGMIVGSPFYDLLSERVEHGLCEERERVPASMRQRLRNLALSALDSLVLLGRQLVGILLTLPFLLVPGIGFMPLFLVTAYNTGLGFADLAMVRNDLRYAHKRLLIRRRRGQLFGLGIAMELLFLVPFLGLFLLPLGVVAGTIVYCRFDWRRAFVGSAKPPPVGFVPPKLRFAFIDG